MPQVLDTANDKDCSLPEAIEALGNLVEGGFEES